MYIIFFYFLNNNNILYVCKKAINVEFKRLKMLDHYDIIKLLITHMIIILLLHLKTGSRITIKLKML